MVLRSADNIMHGKLGFNIIAANNSKQSFLHLSICKTARTIIIKQNPARSKLVFIDPHDDK